MVTESHVSDGTFLLAARETRDGKKGVLSAPETDAGKRRRHRHRKTTERNGKARAGRPPRHVTEYEERGKTERQDGDYEQDENVKDEKTETAMSETGQRSACVPDWRGRNASRGIAAKDRR